MGIIKAQGIGILVTALVSTGLHFGGENYVSKVEAQIAELQSDTRAYLLENNYITQDATKREVRNAVYDASTDLHTRLEEAYTIGDAVPAVLGFGMTTAFFLPLFMYKEEEGYYVDPARKDKLITQEMNVVPERITVLGNGTIIYDDDSGPHKPIALPGEE